MTTGTSWAIAVAAIQLSLIGIRRRSALNRATSIGPCVGHGFVDDQWVELEGELVGDEPE
ncbi:MAG: hypothetical protein ACRD0W_22685 [Acidimicrobiales bacterium]